MERSELFAYLQTQRLGVLGTLSPSLEPQGALEQISCRCTGSHDRSCGLSLRKGHAEWISAPHSSRKFALVGYAVTPEIEIIFDTLRTTRKYRNLMVNPRVSFTVGNADERTTQYEGFAEELTDEALERLQPVYFAAWPDGVARQQWQDITWFVIRPRWIRFTDYNIPVTQEWTL